MSVKVVSHYPGHIQSRLGNEQTNDINCRPLLPALPLNPATPLISFLVSLEKPGCWKQLKGSPCSSLSRRFSAVVSTRGWKGSWAAGLLGEVLWRRGRALAALSLAGLCNGVLTEETGEFFLLQTGTFLSGDPK